MDLICLCRPRRVSEVRADASLTCFEVVLYRSIPKGFQPLAGGRAQRPPPEP